MSKSDSLTLVLPDEPNPVQVISALTESFEAQIQDSDYESLITTAVPGISPSYGIRVPVLRGIAKDILRQYPLQNDALQAIVNHAWSQGTREHKLVALFILDGMKGLAPEKRWTAGEMFLADIGNWEECDQLCMATFGKVIAEDPTVMHSLEEWIHNSNFWIRRAALVTTVFLRNGRYSEAEAIALDSRALDMCAALLEDKEKYIRKAVDWAIRAVIARHEDLAFKWMMSHTDRELSSTASSTLKLSAKKLEDDHQTTFRAALKTS